MRRYGLKSAVSRRGQHPVSMIFGLVLTVITILVCVMIYLEWKSVTKDQIDTAPCASSIAAHSAAIRATRGKSDAANLPIVCPSKTISLDTTDQEVVKKTVALEMKSCWDQWGRGKYVLFRDDGMYCHVCSIVKAPNAKEMTGLPDYLEKNKANKSATYTEYLSGVKYGTVFNDVQQQSLASSRMETQQVAVIFYYAKGRTAYENFVKSTVGNTGAAAGTGAVLGGVVMGVGAAAVGLAAWPVTVCVVAGTAIGSAIGAYESYDKMPEASYASAIVVRSLDAKSLSDMGCVYAPAKNEVGN